MKTDKRKKWIVNNRLQLGLCRRLLFYWSLTWLAILALPICVRMVFSKLTFDKLATEIFSDFWFPMMMSLLVLPIVVWDSIRFSHRIAGPVLRIGDGLRRMADHQTVAPIQLRENDFCHDVAEEFNRLVEANSTETRQPEFESTTAATC